MGSDQPPIAARRRIPVALFGLWASLPVTLVGLEFLTLDGALARVGRGLVGLFLAADGLTLLVNWRRRTDAFVDYLESAERPSVLASVPVGTWRFAGLMILVVSVGFLIRSAV